MATSSGTLADPRGLWLDQALNGAAPSPAVAGELEADVCVVGGGFTGLWTAIRLKELAPDGSVVLIEKTICGDGASGRNHGQVLDWWTKLASFEKYLGVANAGFAAQRAARGVEEIGRFCETNGIDADYRRTGWLWVATSDSQRDAWEPSVLLAEQRGVDVFTRLSPTEARELGGSPRISGGVLQNSVASVHPAKLVRGLRDVALARGVEIYENTPMTAIECGAPAKVLTPAGAVRAHAVVLALGSWLIRFREVARSMFVLGSDIAASDPIPERFEGTGFGTGLPMSDSRMLLRYMRRTDDGRFLSGLAATWVAPPYGTEQGFNGPPSRARIERLVASMRFMFPSLADVPMTRAWTGPVDRSWTGIPFFGRLSKSPNVSFTAGYSGNGVGPSYLAGKVLASMALGHDDEWSAIAGMLPVRRGMPPQPISYIGSRVVRAAVNHKENVEDAGGTADRVTRTIARLAPSGVVPVKKG
jgi:glycine/D-amino acid oxidase-like deaminating enzyme